MTSVLGVCWPCGLATVAMFAAMLGALELWDRWTRRHESDD